jgi:predicted lipoprotein with Yx(FWY)xxD motif
MQKVGSAGDVLVDARGDALYSADQEAGGKIRCTGTCTTIWLPLTVAHGATPTAGNGVSASKLGVVSRPDGKQQVTWNGRPLYRFAQDGGPGKVTGNGAMDSFGGTSFSWHVAAMSGSATTTTTPKSGYGY